MAKVKNVEKRIWDTEGFDIIIRHADGRDMRGDRDGLPQYDFERAAKNNMTVSEWITQRFSRQYSGYNVDVLDGTGDAVQGNMLLGTVRDTYVDE